MVESVKTIVGGEEQRVQVLGVGVHNFTADEILARISAFVDSREFHAIFTPNVDDIVKAQRDSEFMRVLNAAALNVPDGMGIVYASRILGTPFLEMIGGRRLVPRICRWAEKKKWRIYLFGAEREIASVAMARLTEQYPGVPFVGAHSPSRNISSDQAESLEAIDAINATRPDVLFVGLGSPKGKKWIMQHADKMRVPVAIEVGGSFDVIAGVRPTPPEWMTNIGLEWFYRLLKQPRYVWRRYLAEDPLFFWWIIRQSISHRERSRK
ncbi:MAG: WecB/TagA/CpsF family glycosyltransferase [Bacteroidetes bacterium]|nr:WecB/TagA/CpsF family glycosyltransferase [Bacteroidota bacterium]